ncbi:MAG: radical SAM protein [Desulfovibrio sp.]|nr:radical SAM protein [Desulfovibrio sp.]
MAKRFTEPEYRHPLDANALLVRVTQGCTWNRCHYCYVSRDYPFLYASYEEFEEELRAKVKYYPSNTKVWMVGSNPLVLPTDRLLTYIEILRKYFPHFSEIAMQSRVTDVRRKSLDELKALRAAGINELFLGVESGDDAILTLLNKGADVKTALQQMQRLNEAEIGIVPMYMLGGGGAGSWERNAQCTADLLNQVRCRMISTTGLTVFPNTPLWQMREDGRFQEASEVEKIREVLAFVEQLQGETFLYSYHYLNPVHFTAHLPEEKDKICAGLRNFLRDNTASEIEEMVGRQNMLSL